MRTQKRGFFNFLFAFMPGAAEMYMGFMKMGISLMAAFLGTIGIIGLLELSDLFMMIPIVLWFYSFFHARNIATCRLEVFVGIRDDYFWNELMDGRGIDLKSEKAKKIGACMLIFAGVVMLWNMISRPIADALNYLANYTGWFVYEAIKNMLYALPRVLFAVAIIFIGIKLINGKKKTLYTSDETYGSDYSGSDTNVLTTGTIVNNTDNISAPATFETPTPEDEKSEKNA
ncbi:hypothetical protein [Butyrivibrio sp. AE3004]|uniref:hypothetical protein n=1 Tax=Butyrivibrio sp. AE3004 TaxID=1506994 RepID=UPI00068E2CB6|nr:hypothetical protein [Butyrivibrio sp. AE3004]